MYAYKANKRLVPSVLFIGVCLITILIHGFAYGQVTANFSADKTTIYVGQSVKFTDQSTNAAQWDWKFQQGSPSTSKKKNPPLIYYYTAGTWDVRLDVLTPGLGSDSKTRYNYITVLEPDMDYGDAPNEVSYQFPTLLASDGARHLVNYQIYMGDTVDVEADGQQNATATGDDDNYDDEDGVEINGGKNEWYYEESNEIKVTVVGAGYLNVWVDLDHTDDWGAAYDHIIQDEWLTTGTHTFIVTPSYIPSFYTTGNTYARFRFSSQAGLTDKGYARDGEVEDYKLTLLGYDYGDAPDDQDYHYRTLLANDGARHMVNYQIYLGDTVDVEADGLQNDFATGDDDNASDDEDGVKINESHQWYWDGPNEIEVTVVGTGYFNAWVDLNVDHDWDEPSDHIIQDEMLTTGTYTLTVPPTFYPQVHLTTESWGRFRFSTEPGLTHFGYAPDGEVEDYYMQLIGSDFGDAPDPYPTLLSDNGARHVYRSGAPLLSAFFTIDLEPDGQPDPDALGDDNDGWDDEDGITFDVAIAGGMNEVTVTASEDGGYLNAWMDFNLDGDWDDPDEQIFKDYLLPAGDNSLEYYVPVMPSQPGLYRTFARFRLSTLQGLSYDGYAPDGEVEDTTRTIWQLDYGDAPAPYPTVNTPKHYVKSTDFDPQIWLGAEIDAEILGQPDDNATGDDLDGIDDEDGVIFTSPIEAGQIASLTVIANGTGSGYLNAWIDFDGDGTWNGAEEHIFDDVSLSLGDNYLSFNVPANTTSKKTYARFRYGGTVIDNPEEGDFIQWFGEVEDYQIVIGDIGEGAVKWFQPPLKNVKSPYPDAFWGWDEISIYGEHIIADDWFCYDPNPVLGIRWWGSYAGWDSVAPPSNAPEKFHISIWTDVAKELGTSWSHPGQMIQEWEVERSQLNEHAAGSDYYEDQMTKPDTCFQYDFSIPQGMWFFQEGDSTVYWLTISAMYDTIPDQTLWGWKTRDRYYNDDAVRILAPATLAPDSSYRIGEIVADGWDMSFVLTTTEYSGTFDFGDAPDPGYPTMLASNGAQHLILPGQYLGQGIDAEDDGLQDIAATGDDVDGTNDEDGVVFLTDLLSSQTAQIQVTASMNGYLNAWVDFDGNSDWTDPDDQILVDQPLTQGVDTLTFSVPNKVNDANTFARFRFSPSTGVTSKGLVVGGEVEDYEVSVKSDIEESERQQNPINFRLFQNYPNPFNPVTTIRYELPKAEHVLIKIYNTLGREVVKLIDEQQNAGSYTIHWDASQQSSGIYILRIEAGSYIKNIKMIIMQ